MTVQIYTTFGHRLPIDETLDDARFGGVSFLAEGAAPVTIETQSGGYRAGVVKIDKPGAYWLAFFPPGWFRRRLVAGAPQAIG